MHCAPQGQPAQEGAGRPRVGQPRRRSSSPPQLGTPIDPSNLRRTISDLATLADVGHLAPNELRHSAASLLVEAGVPLQQVADMLGHKDIRMLAQTYRHKIQGVVDVTDGQAKMLIG